jgi:hypothetical protein
MERFSNVVSKLTASMSPGFLFETQIISLYPDIETQKLRMGEDYVSTSVPEDLDIF